MIRLGRAAIVLAAFMTAVGAAHAQVQPSDEARRTVVLTIEGDSSDADALEGTLRELFARLGLVVLVKPAAEASAPPAIARVDIDLRAAGEARVVVSDGRTAQVIDRRAVARGESPSIFREELAHIVQASVEPTLLADADRPPPPPPAAPAPVIVAPAPEPPPTNEAPPPVRSSPSALALDLSTLAGLGPMASGSGLVPRVGAGIAGIYRRGVRPSLALSIAGAIPFDTGDELVTSHAGFVSARAIASIEAARASWIALDVGAGGGVDVVSVEPRSQVLPPSLLQGSTSRVDPILTPMIAAHTPITSSVTFTLAIAVDVDLASRSYVLDRGGVESNILSPWRVRPSALAGFTFTAAGQGRFQGADR